jgi:hypothetical protein
MTRTESPRRIVVAALVTLAATAATVPAVAALVSWAFPTPQRRFEANVACAKDGKPRRTCQVGELARAQFTDRREAKTLYTRCVRKPSGSAYCDTGLHTGVLPDEAVEDPLDVDAAGRWRVTWFAAGRQIGSWDFSVQP